MKIILFAAFCLLINIVAMAQEKPDGIADEVQYPWEPSEAVRKNARNIVLLTNSLTEDMFEYFPYRFMNLNKVKEVVIHNDTYNYIEATITLNPDQTIATSSYHGFKTVYFYTTYTYYDGLLSVIDNGSTEHFYYKGDTVYVVNRDPDYTFENIKKYVLHGTTFLPFSNYTEILPDSSACVYLPYKKVCYSNLNWNLPLQVDVTEILGNARPGQIPKQEQTIYEWEGNKLKITGISCAVYVYTLSKAGRVVKLSTTSNNGSVTVYSFSYKYF